jgi:hypothetical protein
MGCTSSFLGYFVRRSNTKYPKKQSFPTTLSALLVFVSRKALFWPRLPDAKENQLREFENLLNRLPPSIR